MMRPGTESELVEAVRGASGGLALRGGATRGPVGAGAALDLSGLAGISIYEPGALTLVAGAGTAMAEIERVLVGEGQRLVFEPPDLRAVLGRAGASTIGGVAAANASGPRRVLAGAARDSLIGVRFVTGQGEVVKSGGRVMKNVTGLDLVKLMAGAHGTLGVLSEVAFKVMPAAETSASISLHAMSVEAAVRAMAAALGSAFEVSGAAHIPALALTHLRIEGFAASVAYRLGRLKELLAAHSGEITVSEGPEALWAGIRDVAQLVGQPGALWRVSVQPSRAPALVEKLPEGAQVLLDWGGGLIWVRLAEELDLRALLGPIMGHVTRMQGGPNISVFQPQSDGVAALSAAIRAKFDPRAILNPGIMG
jgi:glycolate oxidase FAD binding subunit